jgi:threonine synthase
MTPALRCATCGRLGADGPEAWRCACGGPWALAPVAAAVRADALAGRPRSLWRYREVLPVPDPPVTLGEGFTPLVPSRDGRLLFKLEALNPTGSFKDRGAAVLLTELAASGAREVVEDSSGNAGAAIAAYAARAGLRATIFVPAATSPGKLAQMAAYGARVVRVPGSREDVAAAARAAPGAYASHYWCPAFFHGTKTVAYELGEQLGWRAPDWVVTPAGHGTLLLGLALGFRELVAAGTLARAPRLLAVQSAACAPLAGPALGLPPGAGETIAEGIRIRAAARAGEMTAAVRESGGHWAVVDDGEIRAAWARLGAEGLYVEPTGAVAAAAAWRAVERRDVAADAVVVVPLTGHGLKAGKSPAETGA